MKSRVAHRIKQLEALVETLSDHMKVKAMIELRALRLIGYQTQVPIILYNLRALKINTTDFISQLKYSFYVNFIYS